MASGKRVGLCSIPVQQSKSSEKIILCYTSPTSGNDLGTWEHNCMHECENKCAIFLCVGTVELWLISSGDAQLLRRVDLDSELGLTKPTHILLFTPCVFLSTVDGAITGNCVASLAFNEQTGFFWRFVDCQCFLWKFVDVRFRHHLWKIGFNIFHRN